LEEVKKLSEELAFPIFIGVDIDASDGRALGVPRDPSDERFVNQCWAEDGDDFQLRDVVDAFKELGGVVLAAHPYLDDGGPALGDRVFRVKGLAGIQVACGVKADMSNDLALEAANSMALPTAGGSDTGPEGQRLGSYATMFAQEITSQDELVDALAEGLFWAVEIREPTQPRPSRSRSRGGRRGRGGGRGGRGGHGGRR
jgi:hypothetical protein